MLYLASSPDGSNIACACKPAPATFENTNPIFLVWRKVSPVFHQGGGCSAIVLLLCNISPLQNLEHCPLKTSY